jgi:AcrR family transcriptional regulator
MEGLSATTTRRIAREVGCADGTLYVHFRDRVDLLLAVLEEAIPAFLDPMRTLRSRVGRRTVSANLLDAATAALALYDSGGPLWAALFAEPELLAAYRVELRRRGFGPHAPRSSIVDYVTEEQKAGRLSPSVSADAVAGALLGAMFQRAFAAHFLGTPRAAEDDTRFLREVVSTILEPGHPTQRERAASRGRSGRARTAHSSGR